MCESMLRVMNVYCAFITMVIQITNMLEGTVADINMDGDWTVILPTTQVCLKGAPILYQTSLVYVMKKTEKRKMLLYFKERFSVPSHTTLKICSRQTLTSSNYIRFFSFMFLIFSLFLYLFIYLLMTMFFFCNFFLLNLKIINS